MNDTHAESPTVEQRTLRLWPGVLAVTLQWLIRFAMPAVFPETGMYAVLGGLVFALVVLGWWAFFSRVPRVERWGGLGLVIVALAVTPQILHPSIRTGMMGLMFLVYALPVVSLALVLWAVASPRLSSGARLTALVGVVALACGMWALVRSDGVTGGGGAQLAWRWSETPEERLMARGSEDPAPPPPAALAGAVPEVQTPGDVSGEPDTADDTSSPEGPAATGEGDEQEPPPSMRKKAAEWPGFRGPERDGVVRGVRIETDWSASPPVELWRHPVGPGWSSFAVDGDRVYTQEQRGDDEVVTCYDAATGEPVWRHRDPVRFWEANAGAGPRATPTLHGDRVYAFGATGILNALEAAGGSLVWSRNVSADAGVEVPYWGFSGSPLVVDDVVVAAAAGRLIAYDIDSGEQAWLGPDGGGGYSSPHLLEIDGTTQVLLVSSAGLTSVRPSDGAVLWEHSGAGGSPIVQPAGIAGGNTLVSFGEGAGLTRLTVARGSDGWAAEERWNSVRLKPYFNDFVVHEGHAFGFDGRHLACIELEGGERRWKGGRYGNGQLVLLPEQDLLLVVSEEGELALVAASPDGFQELARVPAIEGKTWNHPVLVGDTLLARNDREMVAFRLSLE